MKLTVTYDKVAIKDKYSWKTKEGRVRQKTKEFFQTLNPFNRNNDGSVKSSIDIRMELEEERKKWRADMKQADRDKTLPGQESAKEG